MDDFSTSPNSVKPSNPGSRWSVRLASKRSGEIVEFDSQVMRVVRMKARVAAWASYTRHIQLDHSGLMKMITLTYAPGPEGYSQWRPHHISEFVGKVKKHCKARLLAYAWVAELQERGEVHYHVLLIVQPGVSLPYPDRAGWWPHGMSRIETAHSPGYVVKYSQKALDEGIYPAGLHLFAVWVRKDLRDHLYDRFLRVKVLPMWLHEPALASREWPKRAEGGGWLLQVCGVATVLASPYILLGFSRVIT